MNILLLFDKGFDVDQEKLKIFFNDSLNALNFTFFQEDFEILDSLISKPKSFKAILSKIKEISTYDRVFCFTNIQYDDNYFFHEYKKLTIFSFAYWSELTNLPISNGVIYFIADYIALDINPTDFRHYKITGCIYDFLYKKTGVDDGMRQSKICSSCLKRISTAMMTDDFREIFEDLKTMMNSLSNSSKWNQNVLDKVEIPTNILQKRKPKNAKGINIVLASPGDIEQERKLILETLERRFRTESHEDHCGFRIMVNGWEQIASQNGYPQDVINKKLIAECDFVIAIFKHKLGTPTKELATGRIRAESGTAEELLQAIDNTKKDHPIGMCYFFSTAPFISLDSPDKDKIEKEWTRLTAFKKTIQDKMIYKPYTNPDELLNTILKDLENNILSHIEKNEPVA
jgi:hypothetical protein